MPLTYVGYTQTAAHADLDVLWTHAVNGESNAALALINAAAAQATANTAETDAQTGITNAATAQATANAALSQSISGLSIFNVKASPYNAVGNGIADDTTNIQAACDACDAAGGGIVYFPVGSFLITADLTCTRKVRLMGANQLMSTITAASFKKFKVVGGDVGNVWGGHKTETLGFKRVGLRWGELVGDKAAENTAVDCLFDTCTVGLYQGFNCFRTHVTRCKFIDCTTGNLVDFTTAGATSGASMRFTECAYHDSGGGLMHTCLLLQGAPTGGAGIFDIDSHYERFTVAGIQITGGNNREMVSVTNAYFELAGAAAYFLDNDGATVNLEVKWAWSATEAGWIKQVAGRTRLKNSFGNWTAAKFTKCTGGVIYVDQESIYSPSKFWGNNLQVMWVAGSSNAGKIVSLPSRARGWYNLTTGSLADGATHIATPIQITEAGDANNRRYTCLVDTTAILATDNWVRFNIADGTNSFNLDLVMPLFVGKATVIIELQRGVSGRAYGVFSGNAPGATTTQGQDSGVVADNTDFGKATFLTISTEKGGATAATMTISAINEEIQTPYIADT